MSARDEYKPGAASGAEVRKDGESWTLVVVRDMRHPPAIVWQALTDPEQLREWAPFDVDRNLASVGPVAIATVGTPKPQIAHTQVTRVEPPRLLEYQWGDNLMRWELEPRGNGTRLTLWHTIDRNFISMGAAGWHICLDVLDRVNSADALGRIVGPEAMKFDWPRLNVEYAQQFGVEAPVWPPTPSKS